MSSPRMRSPSLSPTASCCGRTTPAFKKVVDARNRRRSTRAAKARSSMTSGSWQKIPPKGLNLNTPISAGAEDGVRQAVRFAGPGLLQGDVSPSVAGSPFDGSSIARAAVRDALEAGPVNYHWNWGIFFEPNPMGTGTYLDMLLSGLVLTIETGFLAWIIALIVGSIVGVMRTLPSKAASWFGFAYVEFFRNMPLLVQLFLWFFVLPELLPHCGRAVAEANAQCAVLDRRRSASASSCRRASPCRLQAGIASLPRGQGMAATALGLTTRADLSLCAAADGVSHHPAAADFRVPQHHQEHRRSPSPSACSS